MINVSQQVIDLSNELSSKSIKEANYHPVDRYFLNPYLKRIYSVNYLDFIFYNLQNINNLYTNYLFVCLPEIWEKVDGSDIKYLLSNFTNVFSFYTIINFTHKFLGVNILFFIFKSESINEYYKQQIKIYLKNQYYNLIYGENDSFEFDEGIWGVNLDSFIYSRQKLLLDKDFAPAMTLEELESYIKELI